MYALFVLSVHVYYVNCNAKNKKNPKKPNNMNCNYDCNESPSLSSNDCLMKDVTVLICSSVDGLSIFVSFTSRFKIPLVVNVVLYFV
jgi:hypothetical protein